MDKCDYCNGTGEVGGQFAGGKWYKCDKCNGAGFIEAEKVDPIGELTKKLNRRIEMKKKNLDLMEMATLVELTKLNYEDLHLLKLRIAIAEQMNRIELAEDNREYRKKNTENS